MPRSTTLAIDLPADFAGPVFLGVAAAILAEIERGRLKPGDRLPGTRAVAQMLSLHRNTVDAAYHELTMQGWLVAEPARGTFVARDLPEMRPATAPAAGVARTARAGERPLPGLHVSDGSPDPRLMPRAELARAFRRALMAPAFHADPGYGDPRGALALRAALAGHLAAERGLAIDADDVLVTRGSQMGLFLAAGAVVAAGGIIAVETPGYPLAWSAFRAAGAEVAGIPVDGQGIDVEHLADLAAREPRLRAVYVTPHHQYPTTATLGAARRLRLLDIARRHGLTIVEDDYDHEYRFDGRPLLPLAARAEPDLDVIYVSSLSKLLAPAVRLGYVVAPPPLLRRMAERREAIDRQGDLPLERALATLIEDGELRRHARKARRIYQTRRDLLAALVTQHLGEALSFDLPAGGLALWLRLQHGGDAEAWAGLAAQNGLTVSPGIRFSLDPGAAPQAFRFGYASLDEAELRRAVTLLRRSLPPAKFGG